MQILHAGLQQQHGSQQISAKKQPMETSCSQHKSQTPQRNALCESQQNQQAAEKNLRRALKYNLGEMHSQNSPEAISKQIGQLKLKSDIWNENSIDRLVSRLDRAKKISKMKLGRQEEINHEQIDRKERLKW